MGCCVSTPTITKSSAKNLPYFSKRNPTPPPPSHPFVEEEEESVKEVLSETPSLPPKKPTIVTARHQNHDHPTKFESLLPNIPINSDEKFKQPILVLNPGEVSEEASSDIGRSVSMATCDTEKKNDDHDDVRNDNRQRSFRHRSSYGDSRRERVGGKSPSKRSEFSPVRVRSGSCMDASGSGANNGRRRDCGERSGRRSRSPATRTDGDGAKMDLVRSRSAGKTGKSPGRVKSEVGDRIRKVEDSNTTNFRCSSNRESRENKWLPTSSNESLENPLVSLECFIFL